MHMRGHADAFAVAGLLVALVPLAAGMPWANCNTTSNYTANSTYQGNLRLVAMALPGNVATSQDLFAIGITGSAPDMVYALGLCRGDLNVSGCLTCIAAGFQDAQRLCPYNRAVAIFYNDCLVGFSDRDLFDSTTNSEDTEVQLYNSQNITSDVGRFNRTAYELLNATAEYAANTNSTRKFATGAIGFDATYPKIYSMVWCTPELTPGQCSACLAATIAEMPSVFIPNTQGARITGLRCSVRFEVYRFYNSASMVQLPGPPAGVLIGLLLLGCEKFFS